MRKLVGSALAASLVFAGGIVSASAQTIFIGYNYGNVNGSVIDVGSGVSTAVGSGPTFVASAVDFGPALGSQVTTITASAPSGVSRINIFVSETDLDLFPAPVTFQATFSQNLLPPGTTVTEFAYYNDDNIKYARASSTGTVDLGKKKFSSPGGVTRSSVDITPSGDLYSLTEIYSIQFSTPSVIGVLSDITITETPNTNGPVVPETSTWGMMLVGFAGMGFAAFRRSRKASVAIG